MEPWYINSLTGAMIYAVRIGRTRHFTEAVPATGVQTRCGQTTAGDFAVVLDVDTTCKDCAARICNDSAPNVPPEPFDTSEEN